MSEKAVTAPNGSKPFSAYERMIAWRYLRARRKETFISVIAGFSFTGIMLGVATLIIVMAVMNGFRAELLRASSASTVMLSCSRWIGLSTITMRSSNASTLSPASPLPFRLSKVRCWPRVMSGQGLAPWCAAYARKTSRNFSLFPKTCAKVRFSINTAGGVAIGTRMAENMGIGIGDQLTLISPDGDVTPLGMAPRVNLPGYGHIRDRHVRI